MIGKLLGHTQVQTTARYAHLAVDPVKNAANQVSETIAASMADETTHRGHARCVPAHPSEELRDCQPESLSRRLCVDCASKQDYVVD